MILFRLKATLVAVLLNCPILIIFLALPYSFINERCTWGCLFLSLSIESSIFYTSIKLALSHYEPNTSFSIMACSGNGAERYLWDAKPLLYLNLAFWVSNSEWGKVMKSFLRGCNSIQRKAIYVDFVCNVLVRILW